MEVLVERNMIHGSYNKCRSSHSSPGGWTDAGRARSAKVGLVWRCEFLQNDAGDAKTGVQTDMVLDQPDYPGGGRWRSLPGVWVLDTPGSSRSRGRDVHGDCQGPLEARLLEQGSWPGVSAPAARLKHRHRTHGTRKLFFGCSFRDCSPGDTTVRRASRRCITRRYYRTPHQSSGCGPALWGHIRSFLTRHPASESVSKTRKRETHERGDLVECSLPLVLYWRSGLTEKTY